MKTVAWVVLAVVGFASGVSLLALVLGLFGDIGQYELLLIMLVVGVAEFFVLRGLRRSVRVSQ